MILQNLVSVQILLTVKCVGVILAYFLIPSSAQSKLGNKTLIIMAQNISMMKVASYKNLTAPFFLLKTSKISVCANCQFVVSEV